MCLRFISDACTRPSRLCKHPARSSPKVHPLGQTTQLLLQGQRVDVGCGCAQLAAATPEADHHRPFQVQGRGREGILGRDLWVTP